jgi:hypothetical protein
MKHRVLAIWITSIFFFVACCSISAALSSLIYNEGNIISLEDTELFTAELSSIEVNEKSIDFKLDFHNHTIFYYDTFTLDEYNHKYAIDNGILVDNINEHDIVTIRTTHHSGPYQYYEIYSLEINSKIYVTFENTLEGNLIYNQDIREKSKIISIISFTVLGVSLIGSGLGLSYIVNLRKKQH